MVLRTPLALSAACFALTLPAACGSTGASTAASTGTGGHTSSTASGHGGQTGTGGLGPGQCHTVMDCKSVGDFCAVQILPPFCGPQCDPSLTGTSCMSDADCQDAGAGLICDKPCVCERGGAQPQVRCTKGCSTNPDCGPSMVCGATHRCQPAPCAQPSDCTADFTCKSMQCAPKPCTKDADCGGYCVDGYCSALIGTCDLAVP
jgi:hypothetical protein